MIVKYQIMHHNPCFNLFILHNSSFDNQGSDFTFRQTVIYENFVPTTHLIN